MTLFKKQGYVCIIERDKLEPLEHFIERGYFVVSQKPNTIEELDKYIKYSRIYINIKYLKCTYISDIMSNIQELEAKIYES